MRVFIIDTSNVNPELQGGLIGVQGSPNPTASEKQECVETVSQYVMDGWAIENGSNDFRICASKPSLQHNV